MLAGAGVRPPRPAHTAPFHTIARAQTSPHFLLVSQRPQLRNPALLLQTLGNATPYLLFFFFSLLFFLPNAEEQSKGLMLIETESNQGDILPPPLIFETIDQSEVKCTGEDLEMTLK